MKKTLLLTIGSCAAIILFSLPAISGSSGAPAGRSGSPASSGTTCAVSGCHSGGPAATTQTISIASDIPATGFQPNTTYTFTVTADGNGATHSRLGFEASIEDAGGVHQGTLSAGTGSKLVGANKFATHTTATGVVNNSKSWTFTWNSGSAVNNSTLYVAVNFANGNGSTSGDLILTATEVLTQASGIGLEDAVVANVVLSPNPAKEVAHLEIAGGNGIAEASLYSLHGQWLGAGTTDGLGRLRFDLSSLPQGMYVVRWKKGSSNGVERLMIQN